MEKIDLSKKLGVSPSDVIATYSMKGYHDMGVCYLCSDQNMIPNVEDMENAPDICLNIDETGLIGRHMGDEEEVQIIILRKKNV